MELHSAVVSIMKPQELRDKRLQRIGREDWEVCWTVRILTAVQRRPGGRSWKQSSRRKMCMEWREWDVQSADHAHQVVRGRLWFWHTRLFYRRVRFYLVYSKRVICVSLCVLIDPTLINRPYSNYLPHHLINNFFYIFVNWPVPSFSHFISFCRYGRSRPLGTYFLFLLYDAIGVADCMASVIGWLANDELGNVWKEVFMA
jgi:hypothetical protein